MAKKSKIGVTVPTDFDTPVVVNGGVNAKALVEDMGTVNETDPPIIDPYVAPLKWANCQVVNHAGLLFVIPNMMIDLDGIYYPAYDTALLKVPAQDRIYALPRITFEFLFGTRR